VTKPQDKKKPHTLDRMRIIDRSSKNFGCREGEGNSKLEEDEDHTSFSDWGKENRLKFLPKLIDSRDPPRKRKIKRNPEEGIKERWSLGGVGLGTIFICRGLKE